MGTIKCANCDNMLSKQAETCPKCSYPHPKNLGHCRICNAALAVSQHRYLSSGHTIFKGSSKIKTFVAHMPCLGCGEPKPLRKFQDTGVAKFVRYVFVLPAALISLYAFIAVISDHKRSGLLVLETAALLTVLLLLNIWLDAPRLMRLRR